MLTLKKSSNITYLDGPNLALAKHGPASEPVEPIQAGNEEYTLSQFDQAVSHYYLQKAKEHDLASLEAASAEAIESNELAHRLLMMQVSEPRQVLMKLNILENELATDMDLAAPVERKHLLNFAALKADMIGLLAQLAE